MSSMPFAPMGATLAVSASTTTASGARAVLSGDVRVFNATASIAFIKFGGSTVTAATTDTPVPAGGVEVFNVGNSSYAAVILSSGTGTVYFTSGDGI